MLDAWICTLDDQITNMIPNVGATSVMIYHGRIRKKAPGKQI